MVIVILNGGFRTHFNVLPYGTFDVENFYYLQTIYYKILKLENFRFWKKFLLGQVTFFKTSDYINILLTITFIFYLHGGGCLVNEKSPEGKLAPRNTRHNILLRACYCGLAFYFYFLFTFIQSIWIYYGSKSIHTII